MNEAEYIRKLQKELDDAVLDGIQALVEVKRLVRSLTWTRQELEKRKKKRGER